MSSECPEPGTATSVVPGERHADRLALAAVAVHREEAAVHARRRDAVLAVRARPVAVGERRDHEIAPGDVLHLGPDVLDDADELVADPVRFGRLDHSPVGPQVRAAHAGRDDPHQRVIRMLYAGVRDVLDPDVARGMDEGGAHGCSWEVGGWDPCR
jgi:hypothetical protein